MKELSEKEALLYAASYCSGTERCVSEVEKKLLAAGLSGEACRRIIDRLTEEKFIDESRYAAGFVSDKLRFNKWGRLRLDYEMKKKGIPAHIRAEALSNIDPDFYAGLLRTVLTEKKKSTRTGDRREIYPKLYRFAAGRGFESDLIGAALREIFRDLPDEAS